MRAIMTISDDAARRHVVQQVMEAEEGERIEFLGKQRSKDQNKLMWGRLTDISRQVCWYGQWLSPMDWHDIFGAALMQLRVVPGLDGRTFVTIGLHTSELSRAQFSDLLALIDAFAAEKGVRWSASKWIEDQARDQPNDRP